MVEESFCLKRFPSKMFEQKCSFKTKMSEQKSWFETKMLGHNYCFQPKMSEHKFLFQSKCLQHRQNVLNVSRGNGKKGNKNKQIAMLMGVNWGS